METVISVLELFEAKRESLELELLNEGVDLEGRSIADADISSPGVALAGYFDRFADGRMQVFGETEMTFLVSLESTLAADRLDRLFTHEIPAVFVTKRQEVPEYFVEAATRRGVPVLRSGLTTKFFFRRIKPYLEAALAPSASMHGSLADVYGVGLLFVGKSGVGKSECVLDLVERGHRLVADDVVICSRRGNDVIIGRGHELQRHHMEIRGIGIVDVRALFGIRAIRQQKRLEVVVQLETWDEARSYDRTGLEQDHTEILGVRLPKVTIPLNPGKNITVICEVIAMNHLLKFSGVDSALEFDRRVRESIRSKRPVPDEALRGIREYLEEDYE